MTPSSIPSRRWGTRSGVYSTTLLLTDGENTIEVRFTDTLANERNQKVVSRQTQRAASLIARFGAPGTTDMPFGECTVTDYYDDRIERVRFDVSHDGTVEGDDGASGNLACTLRYVCRMGSQIGALLDLGELERLSTLSGVAVLARVSGIAPELSIKAEVEFVAAPAQRPELPRGIGVPVQEAVERALRSVTLDLTCDWTALITDDSRLVGAMHDESLPDGVPSSVRDVGVRGLAVIGALDEAMRESAVRFDFPRGSVLVVPVGEHALFMQADKFEAGDVVRTATATQVFLADVGLAHATNVTSSTRA